MPLHKTDTYDSIQKLYIKTMHNLKQCLHEELSH